MKPIAVLGGGPAGAYSAERLAAAGAPVILFDERLAWEKPCGGGLTYKAYRRYPFLLDNDKPKKLIREVRLSAPGTRTVPMPLRQPLLVYSRLDLNHLLLERAARAGARIEKARVLRVAWSPTGWRLETKHGVAEACFCIVATGARNPLREVGTRWTAADTMIALGYYLPAEQDHIDIQFLPGLHGYIWVFPRCGHVSVGICGKGEPAHALRARLEQYLREKGIGWNHGVFYSHVIPSLASSSWPRNRVAGPGWLAVGDAGGLVDPITGEGLYYAVRSADLASQVTLASELSPEQKPAAYRWLLDRDFAADLAFAASLARRVFLGRFLMASVPKRMIQFIERSPRFREIMQDLFAGTQPYLDLKSRLLRNLHGTLFDTLASFFLRRVVPGQA
ncbi:MAG: NAD(P)/FAD-dependent oxidoreductase [Bryobacterales bacterium]|nr:NAD(P)/FAD-dependent oxidoreductase [Bryobacteraceae bacterium]MDW8355527.1 NAD(P)/FAD-dependent oxidoreductase [Bryobacterales bacterium]